MEQPYARERHGNAVLVTGFYDIVVAYAAASLSNKLYAALVGTLDVVAEGEESIGAEANACVLSQPCLLFLACEYSRLYLEDTLPLALAENVLVLVADVNVDSVVAVCTADIINELESHYLC